MSNIIPIDLFKGWPSPSLLPSSSLLSASQKVLNDPSLYVPGLLYGDDPGYEPLRQIIADWLSSFYHSNWTVKDRITISGGASQCLSCILQVYTDAQYTRNVYMVSPTYYLACKIFEDNGFKGQLIGVPEGDEGIDIEYLAEHLQKDVETQSFSLSVSLAFAESPIITYVSKMKPSDTCSKIYKHVIYCVPTFSNPSGKIMSLRRRQQLVILAREYDALIITDDVYDMLQWSNSTTNLSPSPRLVDLDHSLYGGPSTPFGNTVSNGSFSKIVGPGVRTGWTESTPLFAYGLSQCGSTRSGGAPSQLMSAIIAEMMRNGNLQEHISTFLIPALSRRERIVRSAIETRLLPLGVEVANFSKVKMRGGYFLWAVLPMPLLADRFAILAQQWESVKVASGVKFEVSGETKATGCKRKIRLCFAWEDESLLAEGIARLARVLTRMLAEANVKEFSGKCAGFEISKI